MRLRRPLAVLMLVLGIGVTAAQGRPLKLTTWNMDWLTLRPTGDPALPDDVQGRSASDFIRLKAYADHLDADVIAFEEVDGPDAAAKIFNPARYQLILTPDPIVQRVGLAVRRGLHVQVNPELTDLNVYGPSAQHPLRGGLDVTIGTGKSALRVLAVHLKTGCWEQPLTQKKHSCPTLYRQFEILENWMLERQDDGDAYAVLGDFNRRLTLADPLMTQIMADEPVTLTTSGLASPCWHGEYFIDHILLGNAARFWLIPDSLRVMTYRNDSSEKGLSDHCPVSITLDMP